MHYYYYYYYYYVLLCTTTTTNYYYYYYYVLGLSGPEGQTTLPRVVGPPLCMYHPEVWYAPRHWEGRRGADHPCHPEGCPPRALPYVPP